MRRVDFDSVRRALTDLDEAAADLSPGSAERTARWLAGDPSLHELEDAMSDTQSVTFRCPTADVERADALAEQLAERPEFRAVAHGGRISRSLVLRYALTRGLDVLEDEAADARATR